MLWIESVFSTAYQAANVAASAMAKTIVVVMPSRPDTWIRLVLATVGVPPMTVIAPPLTRILPAASRLIVIELLLLSPSTVRVPVPALNVAVVAAFAAALVPASAPTESAATASRRRRASSAVGTALGHRFSFRGSRVGSVNADPGAPIPSGQDNLGRTRFER